MKISLFSILTLAAASFAMPSMAQQTVYLNKGEQKVETVELGPDEYLSFGRPEGVREQAKAEITDVKTTKNSIKYTVTTKTEDQPYYHMVLSEAYMSLFVMQYMGGKDLSKMTDEELKSAFVTLMSTGYGEGAIGTKTYNVQDGVKNASGETQYVGGGLGYYLVTCDLVENDGKYSLGKQMTYQKITTQEPGKSKATLDVEYKGLDADGHALFSVVPGQQIKTLHMVIGTSRSIDEFISIFGYEWLMFTQGSDFTADQWNELTDEDKGWNVEREDDYSFYVLGVDANGDWVKAEVENVHIKPVAANDCAEIDLKEYSCNDGNLVVTYNVQSKAAKIEKASILVMKENDWDDALNEIVKNKNYENPYEAWPEEVAAAAEAKDVTADITADGKLTFSRSFTEQERDWYVVVLGVTDANGTTVTRAAFHTHIENAEWSILSRTYPKEAKAPLKGKVRLIK